jgi:hypothetical protein
MVGECQGGAALANRLLQRLAHPSLILHKGRLA